MTSPSLNNYNVIKNENKINELMEDELMEINQ